MKCLFVCVFAYTYLNICKHLGVFIESYFLKYSKAKMNNFIHQYLHAVYGLVVCMCNTHTHTHTIYIYTYI